MRTLKDLNVKIFADGADKKGMLEFNANPLIQGMTTNPTLMRKAGMTEFEAFARTFCRASPSSRFRSRFFPTIFRK